MPRPRPYIILNMTGWFVGAAYMPPGSFAAAAQFPGGVGHPALQGKKMCPRGGHTKSEL